MTVPQLLLSFGPWLTSPPTGYIFKTREPVITKPATPPALPQCLESDHAASG